MVGMVLWVSRGQERRFWGWERFASGDCRQTASAGHRAILGQKGPFGAGHSPPGRPQAGSAGLEGFWGWGRARRLGGVRCRGLLASPSEETGGHPLAKPVQRRLPQTNLEQTPGPLQSQGD